MVDVMGAVGDRTGVSAFYISFVLAPLASNASELIAAFNYSLKKTSRTIVISFAALQVTWHPRHRHRHGHHTHTCCLYFVDTYINCVLAGFAITAGAT